VGNLVGPPVRASQKKASLFQNQGQKINSRISFVSLITIGDCSGDDRQTRKAKSKNAADLITHRHIRIGDDTFKYELRKIGY
jgi:hypothetical protein